MTVKANMIARALAKKHDQDFFITECKSGPTTMAARGELLKFDAIAVKKSWTRPCVTIYEIKVNRQDFLADEKWPAYRQFCNRFSFVCPKGLITAEEISNGCGLITYNQETGALFTAKKSAFVDNPLPTNVFYYILMNRLDPERHPFFSDQREFFEQFVQDREERKGLAWRVKSKLLKDNMKLKDELKEAKYLAKVYQKSHEELQQFRELLRQAGIGGGNDMAENLRLALSEKLSPMIKMQILSLKSQLDRLALEVKSDS